MPDRAVVDDRDNSQMAKPTPDWMSNEIDAWQREELRKRNHAVVENERLSAECAKAGHAGLAGWFAGEANEARRMCCGISYLMVLDLSPMRTYDLLTPRVQKHHKPSD